MWGLGVPHRDWFILMGMGGLFILLGIAAFIWGKIEENSYYNAISTRSDVREYLDHTPLRPEFGALKIGGRIAVVVGLFMLAMGGAFLLWS